jgi:hypothetical protein
MRSVIAFLLCVVVAQLSVEAFSPFLATRAIPATKAKGKTQTKAAAKPAKKVAAKKVAVKKVAGKKAAGKKTVVKAKGKAAAKTPPKSDAKAKLAAKAKAKAIATAKAKDAIKANNKAKVDAALKLKAKLAAEEKKRIANRPKPKQRKQKVKSTTSATAVRVANSGTDAALAITKGVKNKNANTKKPLFPGLQAGSKKSASAFKKKDNAKANAGVARKAARAPLEELANPLQFGLQVVQSEKGQEAVGILIDGGLKFVDAILTEGKKTKVVIPRGYDSGSGELKKPKISNIGYKELLDAGIFAGTEFYEVAKTNYEKFYVGAEIKKKVFITEAKIDKKTGKVLKPATENYVVNIGGERVTMKRPLR